ncbi:MAG: hypothetical protein MUF54_25895 [Polyangiaceae bacterium]|nr:hypothetical protein [Polyangiaceae bacterium]
MQFATLAHRAGADRPAAQGEVNWERVAELRPRAWFISGKSMAGWIPLEPAAQRRVNAIDAGCRGQMSRVLSSWRPEAERTPRDVVETYVLAHGYAAAGKERALELAAALEAAGFRAEAHAARGRLHAAQGRKEQAIGEFVLVLGEMRQVAVPLCNVAIDTIELGRSVAEGNPPLKRRFAEALLEAPLAIWAAERTRVYAGRHLAMTSGDPAFCLDRTGGGGPKRRSAVVRYSTSPFVSFVLSGEHASWRSCGVASSAQPASKRRARNQP